VNRAGIFCIVFLIAALKCAAQPVLYGTAQGNTSEVGSGGYIFKYDVATGFFTDLFDFCENCGDGWQPKGSLILAKNGFIFGMTANGGTRGAIYFLDPASNTVAFVGGGNGSIPASLIQASDGLFYSVTSETIFSFNSETGVITTLFTFPESGVDGITAYSGLYQASNGLLYGTTVSGGAFDNVMAGSSIGGVLYSFDIAGNQQNVLYSFAPGAGGNSPINTIVEAGNGLYYGVTTDGGGGINGNTGTLYSYNHFTHQETLLHSFGSTATDATSAFCELIQASDGLLYGVSTYGGTAQAAAGTIFCYNPVTDSFKIVHSFGNGNDGQYPGNSKLMQASDGLLYGVTTQGGDNNTGCIYSYDVHTGVEKVVYSFTDITGKSPAGGLVELNQPLAIRPALINGNTMQVFPNPSSGVFNVQVNSGYGNYTAEVYDVLGQKIYTGLLSTTHNTINLSAQPNGMYFIYLQQGEATLSNKVFIVR